MPRSTETFLDEQLDAIAHFKTFGIRHTLVSGVEGTARDVRSYTLNLHCAFDQLVESGLFGCAGTLRRSSSAVTDAAVGFGAYVLDTVNIGRHIEASGGVRYDRFDNTYKQTVGAVSNFIQA